MPLKPFGDKWSAPNVEDPKAAAAAAAEAEAAAEQKSTGMLTPLFAAGLAALLLFFVLTGAGGVEEKEEASAKSVVFVFEGLKGNIFEALAVPNGNRAPNMNKLVANGAHASCLSTHDPRCSHAQSGFRLGAPYSWQAAPGLISILTGVDATKHLVSNNSLESMMTYGAVAAEYPTVLRTIATAGKKTAAIGTASLLTSVDGETGACSAYGILDFECGGDNHKRCVQPSSCNLNFRASVSTEKNGLPNSAEVVERVTEALEANSDLIVVHLNNLNVAGTKLGSFNAGSMQYQAQLYMVDAIVGQVMAMVEKRANERRENWLIMGVSDHGGHAHVSNTQINDDDITTYFTSIVSPHGPMKLNVPVIKTTQMDVAPTVLKWFGLLSEEAASRMDGRVQSICTTGAEARNCTDADV